MGWNTQKVFTSWSFTRYSDWNMCPAFANYKHLLKLPTPKNDAMQRGADIADATDAWFKGTRRTMPPELKPLGDEYKRLKKDKSLIAEANWGFTKDWDPCSPTDWNRCHLRVKIDIQTLSADSKTLKIDDSKTGKYNDYKVAEYELQLNLYAAAGTVYVPTAQRIETRLLFSDLGIIHPQAGPKVYTRKEAEKAQKEWDKRVKPMLADTRFAPKPSRSCGWCPFSKAKNGPCKF